MPGVFKKGGPQIHNIPKHLRYIFIPNDEESEVTNADMKQAEAMVVAWDAGDELLIEAFEKKVDVHRIRACQIYRGWRTLAIPPKDLLDSITIVCPDCEKLGRAECNHSERFVSKMSGHAFAYDMGLTKYRAIMRRVDVYITQQEAKDIKEVVISEAIKRWQQRVYNELKTNPWQTLVTGTKREFYGILDDKMHRAALSNRAQGIVAHICNKALNFVEDALPLGSNIMTQTHDSLTISNKKEHRSEVIRILREAFDQTITLNGRDLKIPIDITHGPSWGEQH